MAATAMDPVDIANILAQELLYQQVTFYIADSIEYFLLRFFIYVFYFPCCMAWNYSSRFFFFIVKKKIIILWRRKIIVITVILTITYYVYTYNLSITVKYVFCFFVYN